MNQETSTPTNGSNLFDRLDEQLRDINARLKHITEALGSTSAAQPMPEPHEQLFDLKGSVDANSAVDGYFVSASDLKVAGVVTGNLLCNGTLFVTEQGVVNASVTAAEVIVAGELEGQVQCEGRFLVLPTGRVNATVITAVALFEPGARFGGELRLYDSAEERAVSHDGSLAALKASRTTERAQYATNGIAAHPGHSALKEPAPVPESPADRVDDVEVAPVRSLNSERIYQTTNATAGTQMSQAYTRSVRSILTERTKPQTHGLTRNGKRTGRPRVSDREGFEERFTTVLERLKRGELSHRGAARELSIGHATLLRLLRQQNTSHAS